MESITYQSNLYFHQTQKSILVLTKNELYGFIGISMVVKPSWKHYWHNGPGFSAPFISDVLSDNRFFKYYVISM